MAEQKRNSIAPPEGKTRICLDPWAKVFVRSTGDVCLCCNAPPVGSLNNQSIDEIVNGEPATEYRRGLLEGKLLPVCATCPDRPVGEPDRLVEIVTKFLETGEMEIT